MQAHIEEIGLKKKTELPLKYILMKVSLLISCLYAIKLAYIEIRKC